MVPRQPREGLSDIAHRRLCDNAATRTLVWFNASSLFLGLSLSHRHSGDEAARAGDGGRKGERERHKNWGRMVIRRMDTPRPTRRDSIAPVCLVAACRCGRRAIHPAVPGANKAGRQAGCRVVVGTEGERVHLGPLHITCMTDA